MGHPASVSELDFAIPGLKIRPGAPDVLDLVAMAIRFDHKPGLVVYVTAGDPSLDATREIALAAIDAGADVIELGVPFSDPLADGPIIQRASERALERGTRLADVLKIAHDIRAVRPEAGLVIFSYLNPILRYGLSRFADDANAAGVDGVLATDMIVEEADDYLAELGRVGLAPIFLAAPTSPDDRLEAIATHSKGFVYAISRTGITGKQQSLTSEAGALVDLSLIHISEPTRQAEISYAVFC